MACSFHPESLCALAIHGQYVEESSSQLTPEQQTANVGVRLHEIVDSGRSEQRFDLDRFAQFFSHVGQIKFDFIKKFGFTAHQSVDLPPSLM